MYNDIEKKLKTLAKVICCIGIVVCVVVAFTFFVAAADEGGGEEGTLYTIQALAYLIVGPIVSWLISLFMYGFGELIETNKAIAQHNAQ